MAGVSEKNKEINVVMAVDDAAIRMSLGYLFSVVLEYNLRASSDFGEVLNILDQLRQPQVLIVCGPAEESIELIRAASRLPQVSAILALDREGGGSFGANAFRAGAVDVVRPPFGLKEMALRVQLRLGEGLGFDELGQENLNWEAEAFFANEAQLTTAEAQVARILIGRDGEIVTRDELSHLIDHRPWKYGDRKFDVHVAKIRKKFHAAFGSKIEVKTIRSAGYKLTIQEGGQFVQLH